MLKNVRRVSLLALAQGEYCGKPGYRYVPGAAHGIKQRVQLRKLGLIGNKDRLTAKGWREVRGYFNAKVG